MPARQLTLYCRACRTHHPREAFSGRIIKGGRWHHWADCDAARASRQKPEIATDLPRERWYPIHGFDGIYEISNYTRVRRVADSPQSPIGRLMPQTISKYGYPVVYLSNRDGGKCYFVHRLFVESIVGPIPDGLVVNHIDGDKTNNTLDNLEVVTQGENNSHAHRTGLSNVRGESNPMAKLTIEAVRAIRESDGPLGPIAAHYGVSISLVSAIRHRKVWGHVA